MEKVKLVKDGHFINRPPSLEICRLLLYNDFIDKRTTMTEEEIIQLAEEFFEKLEVNDPDGRNWVEHTGTTKEIIEFADKIYRLGWGEGYDASVKSYQPVIEDLIKSCVGELQK